MLFKKHEKNEMRREKKTALVSCTVAGFLKFELNDIKLLTEMGYHVVVATNFHGCEEMYKKLEAFHTENIQIDYARSPYTTNTVKAYVQMKQLMADRQFDLVHCHTPVGGVLTRLAARPYRRQGTKVIYTAHGFHFFKGAPLKNWILYYPVEKWLAKHTDVLITINTEDYERAKRSFQAKKIEYIPGVGVDTEKFSSCLVSKEEKRRELGIPADAFVLLSVGELAERKNQKVVIEALGKLKTCNRITNIHYLIAGTGDLYQEYMNCIQKYEIEDHVILLGHRKDVDELCMAADVFVHTSVREGLGLAALEGMAAGLPLISSYVNGIKDYTENSVTGICVNNPLDVEAMKDAIIRMYNDEELRYKTSTNNKKIVEGFSIKTSQKVMNDIYIKMGGYYHLVRALVRRQMGVETDDVVLLSVGEVNDNKNHEVIIKALSMLGKKGMCPHYVVVGSGCLIHKLEQMAWHLGIANRVHFMGRRRDVASILCGVDIFVFPSKREGLGMAAIEAMASGLPLITSNVHGINDYSEDGVTGYKCSPTDEVEFSEAIYKLLTNVDDRRRFGKVNIERVHLFSKKRTGEKMKSIYLSI